MKKIDSDTRKKIRTTLKLTEDRPLFKSGNAACISIPVNFVRALGWKIGETEITQQIKMNRTIILKAKEKNVDSKSSDTV